MTRKELINSLTAAAEPLYGAREAAAIARLVAGKRYGLSRVDLALEPHRTLDPGVDLERLTADIAAARPVQYILGTADFDGMELAVGEGVLIPRPETEELVRRIALAAADIKQAPAPVDILDIGTGSGAIAIALAKRLPGARVTAVDISPEALKYARENNERTRAGVTMLEGDILKPDFDPDTGPYDIVVSNPPYIPASERARMRDNVTRYEPGAALFVPDDDPLLFYRAIAKFAHRRLSSGGTLWFEIHETAARSVTDLLKAEGFGSIEVRDDMNSKPRMVRCRP